jgi:hypothetical protein
MFIFGILFLGVSLVLIGVGLAVGLAAIGITAGLISLGVLSSSVLIGLRTGRTESGIRALLIQCGILLGIPSGAVLAWMAKQLTDQIGQDWYIAAYGALGGAVAGLTLALLLDALSRKAHTWANQKFRQTQSLFTAPPRSP